jgi:hypothetical protein
MNGLLVKIIGSLRHWLVEHDDGAQLTLVWPAEGEPIARKRVNRSEVIARNEPGVGWVSTAIR